MPPGRPTYLWVAQTVLQAHKQPLRAAQIVTFAQNDGLFSDEMFSKTPQKSLQARLSMDIKRKGENSSFVRVGRGKFFLRAFLGEPKIVEGEPFPESFATLQPYEARPRAPTAPTENVLVVPKERYAKLLKFQGLKDDDGRLTSKLASGTPHYLPRTTAEQTSGYKQIVTYVLVTRRSHVLAFRRGVFSRAAEFLRGSACIGFGGHVTEDDRDLFSLPDAGITDNAFRELQEEIAVSRKLSPLDRKRLKIIGVINDDSSEVGRRHVAVVMRFEVSNLNAWRDPGRGEASVNRLRWIDTTSEIVNLADYEYWSQLCWRRFFPRVVKSQPSFRIIRKAHFKKRHVLVVVGSIGSGKSSVTNFLVSKCGYAEINSGKVLARLMGIPPVGKTSRAAFQDKAAKFISSSARVRRFANALADEARRIEADRIVIDGIRHRTTLDELRTSLGDISLAVLFVNATPDLAYRFYSNREHRGKPKISVANFMGLLNGPTELDVPNLITEADVVLYNWSGATGLNDALGEMAHELNLSMDSRRG
jgi:predicted NUDIX family phosphoesterase